MKKSLLLGIVTLAACVINIQGQGYILLDNYYNNDPQFVYGWPGVPINGVSGAIAPFGTPLSSDWTVGLYYIPGNWNFFDSPGSGLPFPALVAGTGLGSTAVIGAANAGNQPGYYGSIYYFNAGVAAGSTITCEMVVYPTSAGSYAAANYRVHSAPFTMTTVAATSVNPPLTGDFMPTFGWTTPEPSAPALVGLGSLCSLAVLRRRK
jgi:hypothetical protein